ncbi:hypothetical protein J5N97_006255 [Dioscorea zingiberensis]|uniref:BSD2 cysteine rich domain-containing protein n=1 Tax=Dioscorea zingiberensis TaxID=325984 RepID=A0A9D5BTC9_9LILI|nr:hypothetical protein J5N97_001854 [Dioscorea zingiberensis]KAJ0987899.1 hypothetical protein J5N97_006255 [Dioscorea zingiberensis]
MASAASLICVSAKYPISRQPSAKPLLIIPKPNLLLLRNQPPSAPHSFKVKATDSDNPGTKTSSIVCGDCDGNGAILCTQCKGTGVNSVDHFNGQFKAGGLCWLCRGKRDILCGNCNGAGFLGGFMSTFDE